MKIWTMQQVPQGSPRWHELHRGRPTASEFGRIMTPKNRRLSKSAVHYAAELASQVASHNPTWFSENRTKPPSQAMQNGKDTEPEARRYLAMEVDGLIEEVGFVATDDGRLGCSPDGLLARVDVDGVCHWDKTIELKCPLAHSHAKYVLKNELPLEYKCQCHGQLIVTGLDKGLFCSYSASWPRALVIPFERDDFTEDLETTLEGFLELYESVLQRLLGRTYQSVLDEFHKEAA